MPNWADQLRGNKSYGGADMAVDPRLGTPAQPDPMDQAMQQMDSGQAQPGTMQQGRRMGAQQQPGASPLMQLLRKLGLI